MSAAPNQRALHQRISDDLATPIRSGAWPPGFRIPFEHELTSRYACSRATANKAVQSLAAAGLVERRRRAGSFVARPRIQSAVLEIPDMESEITGRGQSYRYELLSARTRRPGDGAEEAMLGPRGPLLELRCRHFAGEAPFAVEERIINLAAVPDAAAVDFGGQPPGAWLLAHAAWPEARHEISAVNPDRSLANALGLTSANACLRVKRWTWRAGAGVTFARQTFPGHAYDLIARFTPGSS